MRSSIINILSKCQAVKKALTALSTLLTILILISCINPTAPFLSPTLTVVYNGNENTGGGVPVDINHYKEGQSVTVLANIGNLHRTGYVFYGWNSQPDGNGIDRMPGWTFSMPVMNVTFYAKWLPSPNILTDPASGLIFREYSDYISVCGYSGNNTTIVIPATFKEKNVIKIDANAFEGNSFLTYVIFPSKLISIGDYAFSQCTGLTGSLNLPDSVTSLGNYAFNACAGLTGTLNLPAGLTSLGGSAFLFCSKLVLIRSLNPIPPIAGTAVFDYTDSSLQILVPESAVAAYQDAEGWRPYANRIFSLP